MLYRHAAGLSLCFLLSGTTNAAEIALMRPNEAVAGLSQAEWSVRWWQWAQSFDNEVSPVRDETGEFCGMHQDGAVWFLAGAYGTKRAIRTCSVPAGKYLFFPLLNYVAYPRIGTRPSCSSMVREAARNTNGVSALVLVVDGKRVQPLDAHRQVSPGCFDFGARSHPPQRIYPAASNGYYIMLRPLPPGRHTLEFGGVLPELLQAVTYTLDVQ